MSEEVKTIKNILMDTNKSEYELVELKVIYDALGQIPVTLDGEGVKKLSVLRDKIKHDFELKQNNINNQ